MEKLQKEEISDNIHGRFSERNSQRVFFRCLKEFLEKISEAICRSFMKESPEEILKKYMKVVESSKKCVKVRNKNMSSVKIQIHLTITNENHLKDGRGISVHISYLTIRSCALKLLKYIYIYMTHGHARNYSAFGPSSRMSCTLAVVRNKRARHWSEGPNLLQLRACARYAVQS